MSSPAPRRRWIGLVHRAIWKVVTLRHILLAAVATLVLGLGLYLFHAVHSSPEPAQPSPRSAVSPSAPEHGPPAPTLAADPDPVRTPGTPSRGAGSGSNPLVSRLLRRPHPAGQGTKLTDVAATDPEEVPAGSPADGTRAQKLDIIMAEANKAYDRGDFDEARSFAQKVLQTAPGNPRMLRILVSAACIEGDGPEAQKVFGQLPAADREQMKTRCSKYGVTFVDPKP
ncbi:MAG: hypothetical protein H6Q90_1664 [Deltaproteobacteria bacterium]|nr:hypothetical protein [Deltaproteobacteria bacterium]